MDIDFPTDQEWKNILKQTKELRHNTIPSDRDKYLMRNMILEIEEEKKSKHQPLNETN